MEDFVKILLIGILFGFIFAILSLIGAVPVYFLWNWLCPHLFRLPIVTYWQAWGLTYLCALLFKSGIASSSK